MNPSNIIIRKISKNAEGKDTENAESFRQRKGTFCFRTTRLGNRGVDEVKKHPFFKNDIWDFSTIRDNVPPVVHELSGDDDTRNFDDVEKKLQVCATGKNFRVQSTQLRHKSGGTALS